MVSKVGRYYGSPFKGSKEFTQGNLLSPTIFNIPVYMVICHWETMVVREDTYP